MLHKKLKYLGYSCNYNELFTRKNFTIEFFIFFEKKSRADNTLRLAARHIWYKPVIIKTIFKPISRHCPNMINFMKTFTCVFIVFLCFVLSGHAQTAVPLYAAKIPNSKIPPASYTERINQWGAAEKVSIPTLTPYLLKDGAAHTALLVIPGGAYMNVALAVEGDPVALALNKIGVTAFVLKYRLPNDQIMIDKSAGPLQDAQSALLMIRKNAKKWNIDPSKVGVIGFSAGGHLASTLGTHFDKPAIPASDSISLRPDFMALIYPVITFGPFTHQGSRESLVGKNPSQALIDLYSNEKQVSSETPPTFIVQAEDDNTVPVQNSLLFFDALMENKVKAEMHIYPAGGHGFGLKNPKINWLARLRDWLVTSGWLNEE
jgi:acetyl esterase/lipase